MIKTTNKCHNPNHKRIRHLHTNMEHTQAQKSKHTQIKKHNTQTYRQTITFMHTQRFTDIQTHSYIVIDFTGWVKKSNVLKFQTPILLNYDCELKFCCFSIIHKLCYFE